MSGATGLVVGSGPGLKELSLGSITDGQMLVRDGDRIVGAPAPEAGPATQIEDASENVLDIGTIGFSSFLYRSGGTEVYGYPSASVFAAAAGYQLTPYQAPNATYDWDNNYAMHVAVTHAGAACDVSLPAEASTTNWPTNTVRRISKMNTSANGINLLVTGNCTINGGTAGADMSPIPDSNAAVSVSALGQSVLVFRESATSYWVFGAA